MAPPPALARLALIAPLAAACGPTELELGLPETPGMRAGLMALSGERGPGIEELYAIDLRTRAGLERVRPLEAGPEAPALSLELLSFDCELVELGLEAGPVALSALGVEAPPTSCVFVAELRQAPEDVLWRPLEAPSAAARALRYASREPSCVRSAERHRCPSE